MLNKAEPLTLMTVDFFSSVGCTFNYQLQGSPWLLYSEDRACLLTKNLQLYRVGSKSGSKSVSIAEVSRTAAELQQHLRGSVIFSLAAVLITSTAAELVFILWAADCPNKANKYDTWLINYSQFRLLYTHFSTDEKIICLICYSVLEQNDLEVLVERAASILNWL